LPDGYAVKKGDMVSYQPYPMGRMKFLWGDDAEEFRPERWLDDDGVFVPESPFKFTAFQVKSLFYFFFWIKEIPILLNMSILYTPVHYCITNLNQASCSMYIGGSSNLPRKGVCLQADEDLCGRSSLSVQV
jgi:hypothetical protein